MSYSTNREHFLQVNNADGAAPRDGGADAHHPQAAGEHDGHGGNPGRRGAHHAAGVFHANADGPRTQERTGERIQLQRAGGRGKKRPFKKIMLHYLTLFVLINILGRGSWLLHAVPRLHHQLPTVLQLLQEYQVLDSLTSYKGVL